ncbi:MAG: PAS domain S-box protein [Myxococcota bacterium]
MMPTEHTHATCRTSGTDPVDLLLAEAGCRALVEAAPDAAVLLDADGRLCAVNERASALFGYARDVMLGLALATLFPERSRDAHDILVARLDARQRPRVLGTGDSVAVLHADGFEFAVDIALSSVQTTSGAITWALIRAVGCDGRPPRDFGSACAHPTPALVPICARCRSVCGPDGAWRPLAQCLREHAEAIFSHGICPNCAPAARQNADG